MDLLQDLKEGLCISNPAAGSQASRFGVQHRYDLRYGFPLLSCVRKEWSGEDGLAGVKLACVYYRLAAVPCVYYWLAAVAS